MERKFLVLLSIPRYNTCKIIFLVNILKVSNQVSKTIIGIIVNIHTAITTTWCTGKHEKVCLMYSGVIPTNTVMKCEAHHCCEVCPPDNTLAFVDDFGGITLREAVNGLNCQKKGKGLQNPHVRFLERWFILTSTEIWDYILQVAVHCNTFRCKVLCV